MTGKGSRRPSGVLDCGEKYMSRGGDDQPVVKKEPSDSVAAASDEASPERKNLGPSGKEKKTLARTGRKTARRRKHGGALSGRQGKKKTLGRKGPARGERLPNLPLPNRRSMRRGEEETARPNPQ